jgi:hypothetical protein
MICGRIENASAMKKTRANACAERNADARASSRTQAGRGKKVRNTITCGKKGVLI